MRGVFISYGRKDDEPFVAQLYADLARHGIALWRDQEAMRSRGRGLMQQIQDGIADFDPLLVIDEVGYIPFEAEAANLFFQLVSARYERASLIVTSNKPFGRWGEVFGDDIVAAAMIDRLVHHAEVVALKGDSYRLTDRDLGRVPTTATEQQ